MPTAKTASAHARPVCRLVPSACSSHVRPVPRPCGDQCRQEDRAADPARAARLGPRRGSRGLALPYPTVRGIRLVLDRDALRPPEIARDPVVRAVLDDRVPPPRGRPGHRRCLRLGRCVRGGLRRHRVGIGQAALLRPVPRAREEQGEHGGEGQRPAAVQQGQEDSAADEREEHGRQGLAVDPAGEQPARLVLLLVVEGDEQPREAVEDKAEPAGDREDRETDPEDHRIHVAVPPEPRAHAAQLLLPHGHGGSSARPRARPAPVPWRTADRAARPAGPSRRAARLSCVHGDGREAATAVGTTLAEP